MNWEAIVGICAVIALIAGAVGWLVGRRDRRNDSAQASIDQRIDRSFVTHAHGLDRDRNDGLGNIADKVNDLGGVQLDIIPEVVQASPASPDELTRYLVASVTNIGTKPALVRHAYIETSDNIPLPACWAMPTGNGHAFTDWREDSPLCFTLMPGKSCQLIFAVRNAHDPVERIIVPDYYSAPWGHLSTARRVVVDCAGVKEAIHSKYNEKLRTFAEWVARNRNRPQPNKPSSDYTIKGVNVPHGRR